MRQRLQKLLAASGLASRRHAEAWLRAGRVSVNGVTAKLGDSADPERDEIRVDGRTLRSEPLRYWLLHKPAGVLTSTRDPEGRPTVLSLVPERDVRLYPVGRLDRDTEGLLLLTNDGETAQALLHPSLGSEREYRVTVRNVPTADTLRRLARGVPLEDGLTAPARVGRPERDPVHGTARFSLTIHEGRKRQIRRALMALGHPVVRLVRVRMGPLELGDLAVGAARRLRPAEERALRSHVVRLREGVAATPPAGRRPTSTAGGSGGRRSDSDGKGNRGRDRRGAPAARPGRRSRSGPERLKQDDREPEPDQEEQRAYGIRRHGSLPCKPHARAHGRSDECKERPPDAAFRSRLPIARECGQKRP